MLTGSEVGLPAGEGVWRPSVVVLADGRIRLYYATIGLGGPSGIFSAISTDGLHFTPEPGQRWPTGNAHIERMPDGHWRLYYTHFPPPPSGGPPDGIASAISTDGLSFTDEPGLRLSGSPQPGAWGLSCCAIVGLADGRYRMYVSTLQNQPGSGNPPPPVYSAVSSDLATWTLEPGVRLTGGWNPAALANPDGSIMLVASTSVFGGTMQTASSPDGLSFTSPSGTNLSGGDPAFVTLPDGRLLMYYSAPAQNPTMISAAVAVGVTAPTVSYPSPVVTAITATSARVSAIVDPHGAMTNYSFEFGRSTGYGDSTSLTDVPASSGQQTVNATLVGLSPATTYHFRVDAYNSVGNANGADQTFRTAIFSCRLARQRDHGWEVALAHATTRTTGARTLRRAGKVEHAAARVERDGCADYEIAIPVLGHNGSATALRHAKRLGFRRAALERT
ncbi:MAG: fibronectin type III domain-containing protein [Gaiellaceae bacterium]